MSRLNPRIALANLVEVRDALEAFGARPFLADGTLLGAIREGGFIAHDLDTDLGLFAEELRPEMAGAVVARGFRIKHQLGMPDRGFQWSFVRHRVKTDVFVYYLEAGLRYHAAWWKKLTVPIRYEYPAFELKRVAFLGTPFWAPADPMAFLERKYGPDWRTPKTDWDWAWGPRNARAWA